MSLHSEGARCHVSGAETNTGHDLQPSRDALSREQCATVPLLVPDNPGRLLCRSTRGAARLQQEPFLSALLSFTGHRCECIGDRQCYHS